MGRIYQGSISGKELADLAAGKHTHKKQPSLNDSEEPTKHDQPPRISNRVVSHVWATLMVWRCKRRTNCAAHPCREEKQGYSNCCAFVKEYVQKIAPRTFKHGQSTGDNLTTKLSGNARRWPETIHLRGRQGADINGYALDTIPIPFSNPWNTWMRTSALDFFPDGRAVVTTHGGDVYIVSGIDNSLSNVQWNRYAAGLFEPFGVKVVDEKIYVTCRDGIKRLHDYNSDGEADFIESFWNDDDVSCVFHGYNFSLQTDDEGNFYLAKAGQHTNHHRPGAIMKVPPQGGEAQVVAWGIRTPNEWVD